MTHRQASDEDGTEATAPALGVPTAPPLPEDVEALLRRLRMPHIRRHAPEVVATAKAQRWEPVEVLRALFAEEAAGRERSALATRRAAAGFPTGKTFDAWEPEASSIPAPTQQALRTLEWVGTPGEPGGLRTLGDREDVPPRSPRPASGRGRVEGRLVHPRGPRRAAPPPPRRRHRHQGHRPDPASRSGGRRRHRPACRWPRTPPKGLYRLVDAAYEKRSVAISSNLHPAAFDELMPKTLATATVDRLLHHAHVCQTTGDSVRLTQALAGQGVSPLT